MQKQVVGRGMPLSGYLTDEEIEFISSWIDNGALIGCEIFNKLHVNVEEVKAEISLESNFKKKEFIDDENKAVEKYLDKIIQNKRSDCKLRRGKGKTMISLGEEGDLFGYVTCHMFLEGALLSRI